MGLELNILAGKFIDEAVTKHPSTKRFDHMVMTVGSDTDDLPRQRRLLGGTTIGVWYMLKQADEFNGGVYQ